MVATVRDASWNAGMPDAWHIDIDAPAYQNSSAYKSNRLVWTLEKAYYHGDACACARRDTNKSAERARAVNLRRF